MKTDEYKNQYDDLIDETFDALYKEYSDLGK